MAGDFDRPTYEVTKKSVFIRRKIQTICLLSLGVENEKAIMSIVSITHDSKIMIPLIECKAWRLDLLLKFR